MAEDSHIPSQFEKREFDASINPCCWVLSCPLVHFGFCPYKTTVTLDSDEAVRFDKAICGERISRRPYGELGSVENNFFCCFVCVDSNLGTIMSGWGCDSEKAEELANVLKERMRNRGDTQQILLNERILHKTNDINEKVDLLKKHLDLDSTASGPKKETIEDR